MIPAGPPCPDPHDLWDSSRRIAPLRDSLGCLWRGGPRCLPGERGAWL